MYFLAILANNVQYAKIFMELGVFTHGLKSYKIQLIYFNKFKLIKIKNHTEI